MAWEESRPPQGFLMLNNLGGNLTLVITRSTAPGVGIASMGVMRPELVMKSIVPVVMAGVLGIYGLIIAVIISTGVVPPGGEAVPSSFMRRSW